MNALRLTLIALLSALSACATTSTPNGNGSTKLAPEFEKLYSDFSAGFAARDIKLLMSTFDKSAVLSYQDTPDTNYDQIKAQFEKDFNNIPPDTGWRGYPEESHQDGNLAVVVAHWVFQETTNGKTETILRIRSVDVLKRTNGKWKIVRSINYPEP